MAVFCFAFSDMLIVVRGLEGKASLVWSMVGWKVVNHVHMLV
jgi:hypothetical protein